MQDSSGGLVKTFVPPETIKAVAALLKPGTPKHSHMLLTALSSGYGPLRQKAL